MSDDLPVTTPPGPSFPVGLGGEANFIIRQRDPKQVYPQYKDYYLLYSFKFSAGGYNYNAGNIPYPTGELGPAKIGIYGNLVPMWRCGYKTFVKILKEWFKDPTPDPLILRTLRQKIQEFIPVRSGNLATRILSSFFIERRVLGARCKLRTRYHYPTDYPGFIKGRTQHAPPDIGYGKHPRDVAKGIRPPNITLLRTTKKGAYYLLNDPRASKDLKPMVNAACAYYMQDIVATFFNHLLVIIQL